MNTGIGASAISISGVTHRYRKHAALDDLTLDLPSGKLVGFIGPDGVGKSTLLGLITGAKKLQNAPVTVFRVGTNPDTSTHHAIDRF